MDRLLLQVVLGKLCRKCHKTSCTRLVINVLEIFSHIFYRRISPITNTDVFAKITFWKGSLQKQASLLDKRQQHNPQNCLRTFRRMLIETEEYLQTNL